MMPLNLSLLTLQVFLSCSVVLAFNLNQILGMGEFNLMSYKPSSDPDLLDDAGNVISGNAASTGSNADGAHGVFTISAIF